jgi:hypothetical protein
MGFQPKKSHFVQNQKKRNIEQHNVQGAHHPHPRPLHIIVARQ